MTGDAEENRAFDANDVEVSSVETPFRGYFRMDRYRFRHRRFAGGWTGEVVREVFERGHAVAVLLYDPLADAVVLIEQFRVGALAAFREPWLGEDRSPWLIELVAGIIDAGETAPAVARREAIEEAGCHVDQLEEIARFLVSPGGTSETIILYAGRVDSAGIGGLHGLDHEDEDIRVHVVPSATVFRWLDEGRIINAQALIGLQWFRLHRDALRARWLAEADVAGRGGQAAAIT
ncbi:MAG: NUDIX domain-containing protein [Rhodospirillales bacterium]|nr:NUDIX domain-containing protein [Rhodospirillales bacterium]